MLNDTDALVLPASRAAGARRPSRAPGGGGPERPAGTAVPEPPPQPRSLEECGLSVDGLGELLLKTLLGGEATGSGLADRLRLPYGILEGLVEHARIEKLVEVRGTTGTGTAGYRYALTDLGRDRARQYLEVCRYIGPAPVPLAQYVAYIRAVSGARSYLDRQRIATGFDHLVVSDGVLDQLGPAVNSGKSLFLYGPPGNGKTVIAEGIGRALGGDLYVPWAIDVDGQIITMFDPVNHQPRATGPGDGSVIAAGTADRRWECIRRPVVTVGGELTLEMLDLTFNPIARFYEAPIQLKANGGVFVVDDFGRQRIAPRDLLNRWIVPLESRVDYLTLHTGRKFEVPFDVLIVFATNLQPETLADEAFLRRIPYKIYAKDPTLEEYGRIFELNCRRRQVAYDPVVVEYLHRRYYQPRRMSMRACHPRDLIDQVVDLCRYQNRDPKITRELLDTACQSYFLQGEGGSQPASTVGGRGPVGL
jgi:hypothetical protein